MFPQIKTSHFEYSGWKQFPVHCATILWMDHLLWLERQQGKLGFWWISHRPGIQKALLLSDQSEPSVHVTWSELTNQRPGIQSSLLSVWAAAEFAVNTGLLWIFHVGTGLGSTPGLNLNNEQTKQFCHQEMTPIWYCSSVQRELQKDRG